MTMTLDDLKALVAQGESESLEFKETTGQRGDGAKAVCAMLNGQGGYALFGVTDRGEIRGQQVTARSQEDVDRELRRIEPPAFPAIEVVPVEGDRSVIVLRVTGSNQGPYTYDGRPYLRQGPQTLPMPRSRYEQVLLERLHGTQRWENDAVPPGVGIQDLNHEEIRRVLNAAVQRGRMEQPLEQDIPSILRGFGLMRDGALLQAAVALFGQAEHLQGLYPQFSLSLGRFRGLDRLAPFEDNRRYWGHAFQLLQRAESFLLDHNPIASRVLPKREREDLPTYLPAVTREALANALCHRDYAQASGGLTVAMYDDRLEITNPGTLHFGLTPQALTAPHESRPWNPLIARVFYRAGIIESWGSGTVRMIEACRAAGRPLPTWENEAEGLRLVLPSPTPQVTPQVTPEVARLLWFCLVPMTRQELQVFLGLKDPDHVREAYIRPALDAGLVEMTLPDKPSSKTQRYRLTPLGKSLRPQVAPEDTPEDTPQVTPEVSALLAHCQEPRSRKDLQALLGLKDAKHFRETYLQPALGAGFIEMTIPDKPKSSSQKYQLTESGRRLASSAGGV